jgi:hypothetical protein
MGGHHSFLRGCPAYRARIPTILGSPACNTRKLTASPEAGRLGHLSTQCLHNKLVRSAMEHPWIHIIRLLQMEHDHLRTVHPALGQLKRTDRARAHCFPISPMDKQQDRCQGQGDPSSATGTLPVPRDLSSSASALRSCGTVGRALEAWARTRGKG